MTALDLRACRERLGLTQVELGQVLGVHSNTIAKWERGEQPIRHVEVVRLALERLEQKRKP
jgi:transcriptional regulator with XRE-family HTH domain